MAFLATNAVSLVVGLGAYKLCQNVDMGFLHKRFSFLACSTTDMGRLAEQGQLKRAFGRKDKMQELISAVAGHGIVLLVGDPGVGKTAMAEELAVRATFKEEQSLHNVRVLKLDFEKLSNGGIAGFLKMLLNGGAHEFFNRLLDEMVKSHNRGEKIILFIDEFDRVMTACPDVFNSFLDNLARTAVILGATTEQVRVADWREGKAQPVPGGLPRRIHLITVTELSSQATVEILKQDRPRFERLLPHVDKITVEDQAIEAAVILASQYKSGGRYPHHAIELLEAAIIAAQNQGITTITGKEVGTYLALVRNNSSGVLQGMVRSAQEDISIQKNFFKIYFPSVGISGSENAEVCEIAGHLLRCFSSQSGKSRKVMILGSSPMFVCESVKAFYERLESEKQNFVVKCSVRDLMAIANKKSWSLKMIQQTLGELRRLPTILFIEDGHLLAPYFFPQERSQPSSESFSSLAHPTGQVVRTFERVVNQVAGPGIVQEFRGLAIPPPVRSSSCPSTPPPVIVEILTALRSGEIDYILGLPSRLENIAQDDQSLILKMKEFSFFEIEQELNARYNEPKLVRKTLYTVFHLKLAIGGNTHPADVAYLLLEEAFLEKEGVEEDDIPEESDIQQLIVQKCPGVRLNAIKQAWEGSEVFDKTVFTELSGAMPHVDPAISTILSTFLGRVQSQILRVEGGSLAYTAFVQKQMKSFLDIQRVEFLTLDLSPLQLLSLQMQEDFFLECVRKFEEERTRPVLAVNETDLEKEFVRKALKGLVDRDICHLVIFTHPAQVPAVPSGVSALTGAVQAVQSLVGFSTNEPQQQPAPPPPSPALLLGFENVQTLTHLLPKFTAADVGNLASTLIPDNFPPEAATALISIYSSIFNEKGMTPDILARDLQNDFAYIRMNAPVTCEKVIRYLAQKHQADEDDFKYAVDPEMTSRSYRIGRAFKTFGFAIGSFLMKPLKFVYNHMSKISFTLFTAGALRALGYRLLGLFGR